MPHDRADSRGRRRYFTIASSPSEEDITIVMRVPPQPSSVKRALLAAPVGWHVVASRLAGDFVLPDDTSKPLAFIAGGVGIAPFRSMAQHMVDTGSHRDIVMLYANWRADEVLFQDVFEGASKLGMKTKYVLSDVAHLPAGWTGPTGLVDAEMVRREVPDYLDRTFFVSGPHAMVRSVVVELRSLGAKPWRIKRDFYDGAAGIGVNHRAGHKV